MNFVNRCLAQDTDVVLITLPLSFLLASLRLRQAHYEMTLSRAVYDRRVMLIMTPVECDFCVAEHTRCALFGQAGKISDA